MKHLLLSLIFAGCFFAGTNIFSAQNSERIYAASHQKNEDGMIVAYPNPARDFILVKAKEAHIKIKSVTFYSILGLQVAEFQINKNSEEIRLDKLRPGKYLMRYVLSDNTQEVTQIIKQ